VYISRRTNGTTYVATRSERTRNLLWWKLSADTAVGPTRVRAGSIPKSIRVVGYKRIAAIEAKFGRGEP
jgi:hypothetical protein